MSNAPNEAICLQFCEYLPMIASRGWTYRMLIFHSSLSPPQAPRLASLKTSRSSSGLYLFKYQIHFSWLMHSETAKSRAALLIVDRTDTRVLRVTSMPTILLGLGAALLSYFLRTLQSAMVETMPMSTDESSKSHHFRTILQNEAENERCFRSGGLFSSEGWLSRRTSCCAFTIVGRGWGKLWELLLESRCEKTNDDGWC